MFQKVINTFVVFNFVFAGTITGVSVYTWVNREALAERSRERLAGFVAEAVGSMVPGLVDSKIPSIGGPAIPPVGLPAPSNPLGK